MDVANLAAALADFGAGYLLTARADGRVKAVTVEPEVVDGVLRRDRARPRVERQHRRQPGRHAAVPADRAARVHPAGRRHASWTATTRGSAHQRRPPPAVGPLRRPARAGRLWPRLQAGRVTPFRNRDAVLRSAPLAWRP